MSTTSPGAAWKREDQAAAFLEDYRGLIPALETQEDLIKRLLGRRGRTISRFLDLGAGAGALAELVMDLHPGSSAVLVDFSEPMIATGRECLEPTGRWEYVRADLSGPDWLDELPNEGPYDAVVSGFCIHHLPDPRKRALYQEIFTLLAPGGIFLNWEHVAAAGLAEGMLEECMVERLVEAERRRDEPRASHVVAREYVERAAADEDILLDPETQCDWLRAIGFGQVDTYFKMMEVAIIAGVKESS